MVLQTHLLMLVAMFLPQFQGQMDQPESPSAFSSGPFLDLDMSKG